MAFTQPGASIPWTNLTGALVPVWRPIVFGKCMAVALADIPIGATGAVGFGVYTVPKVSGAVIAQGENIIWDASAVAFDDNLATPAAGDVSNCVLSLKAYGNGITTMEAIFSPQVGTVT